MMLIVAAEHAAEVVDTLATTGFAAWPCGEVSTVAAVPAGAVWGTKGVSGGSARLVGAHPHP